MNWSRGRVLGALVVFALVALLAFGYHAAYVSLEAERTHQAYGLVLDILTDYLRDRPNQWPTNWDALTSTSSGKWVGSFHWPEDLQAIRGRVRVNFSLTRREVAKMHTDDFSAVEPLGPNYGRREWEIKHLLDAARQDIGTLAPDTTSGAK